MKAGKAHVVEILFQNIRGPADGDPVETLVAMGPGLQLGGAECLEAEAALDEAAAVAQSADVAIVVVGLNGDWETEGYDRTDLELPGQSNKLVSKVLAANPNTVVVCQSVSSIISLHPKPIF